MLKPKTTRSRAGQAMMEFLPAMMVFTTVVSGAFSFYKAVRWATIRQETTRNLAMATISNSGTLTTPSELADTSFNFSHNVSFTDRALASSPLGADSTPSGGVLPTAGQPALPRSMTCFQVSPARPGGGSADPFLIEGLFGSSANPDQKFEILSRATIYRGTLASNGFGTKCR